MLLANLVAAAMSMANIGKSVLSQSGSAANLKAPKSRSLAARSASAAELEGTRLSKDWEVAADLQQRSTKFHSFTKSRHSCLDWSITGREGTPQLGIVLTRAPVSAELLANAPVWQDGADALERKALALFRKLDVSKLGILSLDILEESFDALHSRPPVLRMTRALFDRYVKECLPSGCEKVNQSEYLCFHRHVWQNQPISVRRQAQSKVSDLLNVEDGTRRAFQRYAGAVGYIHRSKLPSLLEDLGLFLQGVSSSDRVEQFYEAFHRVDTAKEDCLSYQDFVRFYNQFVLFAEEFEAKRMVARSAPKSALAFKAATEFRTMSKSSSTPLLR